MKVMKFIKKNKLLASIGLIYLMLFIFMPDIALKAAGNSGYYLFEMFEVLPVIFLLTVVIEALIPKEMILKHFGEDSGFVGNLLSLLLGSISAGPIYAAFPICKMLLHKGASVINIVILLSTWAVIKLPMLANEAKFLGLRFMVTRWLLTVVAIFIMAYVSAFFVKKGDIPLQRSGTSEKPLEINENYCIGCGLCVKLAPEYYRMNGKKAVTKDVSEPITVTVPLKLSVQKCPTQAIAFHSEDTMLDAKIG